MIGERGSPEALEDPVDQASMDSFPASDPPSFWARSRPNEEKERPGDRDRAEKRAADILDQDTSDRLLESSGWA